MIPSFLYVSFSTSDFSVASKLEVQPLRVLDERVGAERPHPFFQIRVGVIQPCADAGDAHHVRDSIPHVTALFR